MSDPLIVSCRLCLEPDELPSMVTVERLLANPPRTVSATICRPCARLISETLDAVYLLGAQEAPINDSASDLSDRGGDRDLGSAATDSALVSESESGTPTVAVDRPEPEATSRRARRRE
jgi:hypothetical protein